MVPASTHPATIARPRRTVAGARAGFTLMEMLLVISVSSLMLAIAGPRMVRTMARENVRAASVQLTERLVIARQTAIRRNGGAVLHVASGKVWVAADNGTATPLPVGDTLYLSRFGVTATASIDTVRFDARGFSNLGASQTFVVTKDSQSQTVCVTAAGLMLGEGCTL
jgi:prepilin-type N-terminal cleavage/methylation domain-containing protein